MTYSIGFRIPNKAELARELLQRLAEDAEDEVGLALYEDPDQVAVPQPAQIPQQMLAFAKKALHDAMQNPHAYARGLGEYLTEPKPNVWFDAEDDTVATAEHEHEQGVTGLRLDRRTKMMFDTHHIFINGESFVASGADARLLRLLANTRCLAAEDVSHISVQAMTLVATWVQAGWLHRNG